jgi:hypothetical protein
MKSETIAIATNYLDRYLSRRSCAAVELQLAATGCIFLAAKLEEARPFRTSDLTALSGGLFAAEDLRVMEMELLVVLNWYLNPPTANACVFQLSVLVDRVDAKAVEAEALRYCALARGAYGGLRFAPSLVAVAATVCALRRQGADLADVRRFLAVVTALDLPYARAPGAAQAFHDCGTMLLEAEEDARAAGDAAADAEVDAFNDSPDASDDDGDVMDDDDDHAPSPIDVADALAYATPADPEKSTRRESFP